MDQISSRKLEDASIQMGGSSEHLFSHHKDHSKFCTSRSETCSKRTICILGSLLCLLIVMSTAALVMSALALWSSQTRRMGTTGVEYDNSAALNQVCNLHHLVVKSALC